MRLASRTSETVAGFKSLQAVIDLAHVGVGEGEGFTQLPPDRLTKAAELKICRHPVHMTPV
jgi:hypothetical protein